MNLELEKLRADVRYLLHGIVQLVHMSGVGTDYCRQQAEQIELLLGQRPPIEEEPEATPPEKDELFDKAVEIVRKYMRVSTSLLQYELQCTYTKSALLIDQLEAHGIISPKDGAKPRKVL